jgi:hypothetical protein
MDGAPSVEADLDDRDLVVQFESLGDNCELGLVQRRVGAEPLGLLRFSGTPLRNLLRAMAARFSHIGDPAYVRLNPEHGEYMVKLTKYDFTYHADAKIGEADPDRLLKQQTRVVSFLARKLIEDLEEASKIFVFRQNEPLSAIDLIDLRLAIAAYGPGRLLWVQPACTGHPPGSVALVDERLMIGYVRRLASREAVPDLDFESWIAMLRRAYRLSRETGAPPPLPPTMRLAVLARTDITFGFEGNAIPHQGYGWSGAEAGYTWAVGERSLLTVPLPGDAEDYWLELDVAPFIRPPLLNRQRLDIFANGTFVHSFDPLPRAEVGCVIPGRLVAQQPEVQIVFGHPHAASPMLLSGQGDSRRLGVSFARVSLICA